MQPWMAAFRRTVTPSPAPRPGPRLRRGHAKARAPVTRKPCLGAPQGAGLIPSPCGRRWRAAPDEGAGEAASPHPAAPTITPLRQPAWHAAHARPSPGAPAPAPRRPSPGSRR
ncbi:hypothetical protein XarjCFBP7653_11130 [Xanthomonas arboricola]|nr:hypothetical protein XarjCFBP7653_11130 [Xanthomonas arboricola]